jgi:hypothetical protein
MLRFVIIVIMCAAYAAGFSIPKCKTGGIKKQEYRLKTSKGLSVASLATESKFLMSTLMIEGTRTINILRYESLGRKLAIVSHPVTIIVFLIFAKSKIGKGIFNFFARIFRSRKPKVQENLKEVNLNTLSKVPEALSSKEEKSVVEIGRISDDGEEKKQVGLTQMQRKELADTYNIKVIENRLNSIADSKEKLRLKLDQETNEAAYFKNIALQRKIAYQASISKGRAKELEEVRLIDNAKTSNNMIEGPARVMKTISEEKPIVKEINQVINEQSKPFIASEVLEQQDTVRLKTIADSKVKLGQENEARITLAANRLEYEVLEKAYFKSMALKSKTAYQTSLSKGMAKDAEAVRAIREGKVRRNTVEEQATAMIALIEEQRSAKLIIEEQTTKENSKLVDAEKVRKAGILEALESEARGIADFKNKALQNKASFQASISRGRAIEAEENRVVEEAKASRRIIDEEAIAMKIVSEEKRVKLVKDEQTARENAKLVDADKARIAGIAENIYMADIVWIYICMNLYLNIYIRYKYV